MKNLLSHSKASRVVKQGSAIYNKIRGDYEPHKNGRYLAIEPDTKKVYFGTTGVDALQKARRAQSDKFFYLVKIGYDTPDMILSSVLGRG